MVSAAMVSARTRLIFAVVGVGLAVFPCACRSEGPTEHDVANGGLDASDVIDDVDVQSGGDVGEPVDSAGGGDTETADADGGDTEKADADTTGRDGTEDASGLSSEDILFSVDFDDTPLGTYSQSEYASEWPEADWTSGLEAGRGTIVETPDGGGRALEVLYPADTFGPGDQGVQWLISFDDSYEELYLRYRVRFQSEFEFVKGGKLPGLVGGEGNTGGEVPDGTDGWSARLMWRRMGEVVDYVYHPDQSGTYGEDFAWKLDGREVQFEPGTWHTLQLRVVMNTPGASDGRLQGWFDGRLALDVSGMQFRDVPDFAVDGFYFSTFFGGGDQSWAPSSDMHIYFDEIVVATERIPSP